LPEGDAIYRAARTLHRALAGETVIRFETRLAPLAVVDHAAPIAGRAIERVESVGKHLLIAFADDLLLRTHMRMNGSWHIYRPGERWQAPAHSMRILIETANWVAVAFNVYAAEFIDARGLPRNRALARLGPDLLGEFDRELALASIRSQGDRPMHDVLLDQRVMSGIGNIYKSEILFLAGIHPDVPAGAVDEQRLGEMVDLAQKVLRANVSELAGGGITTYRGLRSTTGRGKPEDRLWVYSRSGQPCRRCGARIASRKDGDAARVTYWCPGCQRI
jgi:endonuclease-8